jgi:steroid Delta-isomerase
MIRPRTRSRSTTPVPGPCFRPLATNGKGGVAGNARGVKQSAVADYFGAVSRMDVNAVGDAFAPDGVSHDPVGTPPHEGRDAIREFMQRRLGATERLAFTVEQIFVAGDSAAVKWTAQLTSKNGRSAGVEGIDVIHVNEHGKTQALHAYWDPTPVLSVLEG